MFRLLTEDILRVLPDPCKTDSFCKTTSVFPLQSTSSPTWAHPSSRPLWCCVTETQRPMGNCWRVTRRPHLPRPQNGPVGPARPSAGFKPNSVRSSPTSSAGCPSPKLEVRIPPWNASAACFSCWGGCWARPSPPAASKPPFEGSSSRTPPVSSPFSLSKKSHVDPWECGGIHRHSS